MKNLKLEQQALKDFEEAYELNPRNDRAIAKVGLMHSAYNDRKAEAYAAIYEALELNPNNSLAKMVQEHLN